MSTKPETKPWYMSKTIWLGVLTALAAAGEYATGALSGLMSGDQMTLLVAAVGVLGTVLRLFTGQPVAVKKAKPTDSGHVRLPLLAGSVVLAVVLSAVVGCAMTPAQRLATVATSVNALHASAASAWSDVCKAKAEVCVKDGVTASKDCTPWVSCQAALKRYYEAHMALQRAIQTAAWYLLNDNEAAAQKVLYAAQMGLAAAYELAKAEGAIK